MSFDPVEANAAFARELSMDLPLLSDTTHEMAVAYGAADTTDASLARRVGVILDPEGRVAHWLPSVSPSTFPHEALGLIPDPA